MFILENAIDSFAGGGGVEDREGVGEAYLRGTGHGGQIITNYILMGYGDTVGVTNTKAFEHRDGWGYTAARWGAFVGAEGVHTVVGGQFGKVLKGTRISRTLRFSDDAADAGRAGQALRNTKPPDGGVGNDVLIKTADNIEVKGFTRHGLHRAIGDGGKRAGVSIKTYLSTLKNPDDIIRGVDDQGRPFVEYITDKAKVVINPENGKIVTINPLSGTGMRGK